MRMPQLHADDDARDIGHPGSMDASQLQRRVVIHLDLDCFYAQVEAKRLGIDPSVPLAVQQWSGLIAVNYPARHRGVKRHLNVTEAKKLVPELVCVHVETIGDDEGGHVDAETAEDDAHDAAGVGVPTTEKTDGTSHDKQSRKVSLRRYRRASWRVMSALADRCEHVERAGSDEAYVDVTGLAACGRKTPREIAEDVRAKIFAKTGCVASVGSGPNRLIARLATKRAKPDGSHHVPASNAASFLASMPVAELPGVGRGTLEKLRREGIGSMVGGVGPMGTAGDPTCADVAAAPLSVLRRALGPKAGAQLRDASRGIDARAWEARPPRKSVGAQVTWGVRFAEAAEAVAFVEKLCAEVSERMRRLKVKGRTLTLKILRAVANAPATHMKGSIGHGVCDHLTRSSTVS